VRSKINERGAIVADADTLPLKTYANLFLAALPPKELNLLQADLRLVEFPRGTTLNDAGDRIDDVLFIESGMVSLLTTMSDGAAIENATLGRESILGVMGALGSHRTHMRAVVQIPVTGWRIRAADFRAATDKSRHLRQLVLRSSELLLAQVQQTAACNALHSAERRLCRWILQVRDRIDSDTIYLTQDFLAQMLAVRRPTVTLIAQGLQNAGLISYRRGRIEILDREGLERQACECVNAIRIKMRQILSELE
jgi:CRP-like cAMP-binding protein